MTRSRSLSSSVPAPGKVPADMNAADPTPSGRPVAPDERVWPAVSVIMPVLDEERHLAEAVAGVLAQEYPGELELLLALGPSRDRTDEIARELAAADPRVRLVANPAGRTPAGLNAALGAARHGVVVRVDGHGVLSDHYIRTAVAELERTGAANVGGIMNAEGQTDFERAVAWAYTSPFGLGGAKFHLGGQAGPADTVYLGVFRREVLDRLGGFDEHFVRAQDWELNYRIRAAGETVWFTPDLVVSYRPRPNLRALARQFLKTGQWRREVVRRYPDTANVRYLAAPAVTVAVAAGTAAGLAGLVGPSWLLIGWLAPAGYAAGVTAAALLAGRGLPAKARAWLPPVLATMHLTWGAGFLLGSRDAARSRRADHDATAAGGPAT
ncbi:Glycosyltransferase like family 2 [Jiangella sp. DSM 45060]|nr:Glycosyltransferase like family 2 [Jiangella sp. DSM 45060]